MGGCMTACNNNQMPFGWRNSPTQRLDPLSLSVMSVKTCLISHKHVKVYLIS